MFRLGERLFTIASPEALSGSETQNVAPSVNVQLESKVLGS